MKKNREYCSVELKSILNNFANSFESIRTFDEYCSYLNLCNFCKEDFIKISYELAEYIEKYVL